MVLPARYPLACHSVRARLCKVPVRARSRSDNYAAVLRLQNTQPKDRRIYTALTGILVVQQSVQLRKAGRGRRGRRKLQAARGKHEQ